MKTHLNMPPIAHIAKLAKLQLTSEQIASIEKSFPDVMDLMKQVSDLDLSAAASTARVSEEENVFRDDVVTPSFTQQEALSNAKESVDGFFVTTAVAEEWNA